jgi:hypothetical protein
VGKQVRRIILLGLIASVVAGACGGKGPPAATQATVPQSAPSTTAADPYAVPATIDAAYLNRVFAALDAVDSDATRIIVETRSLPPAAADRLVSIYGQQELPVQTARWLDRIDAGLPEFKPHPGAQKTTVVRLLSSRPTCVFATVKRDHTAVAIDPPPSHEIFVYLAPLDPVRNQKGFNPTPWAIGGEGFNSDGSMPGDPCAA